MADRKALLDLTKDGCCVVVDGLNLSEAVQRVLLTAQAGEPPTLVLELSTQAFRVDAAGAHVGVSPLGEHILTQLGWRPPDGEPKALVPACSALCKDIEQDRDVLSAERDSLAALLDEVLRHFTQPGHPGTPCLRTGWVPVSTVLAWSKHLDVLTRPPELPPG